MQPISFYKYMTIQTAIKVLSNRKLRWSAYHRLNDAHDLRVTFRLDGNFQDAKTLSIEKLWEDYSAGNNSVKNISGAFIQYIRSLNPDIPKATFAAILEEAFLTPQEINKSIENFNSELLANCADCKILCLTDSPENRLMWAHYAEEHAGLVMKFENVPTLDSPYKMAKPVQYVSDYPTLFDIESLSDLLSGRISLHNRDTIKKIMDQFAFTKNKCWAYEREWRIALWGGKQPLGEYEDSLFHKEELKSIIFGVRTSEKSIKEISEIVHSSYPSVQLTKSSPLPFNHPL